MNLSEDIRSITYMKSNAADLLDQVNQTKRPVVITQNGEARAVLLSPVYFDELRQTVGLLKLLAQSEQEIAMGKSRPQEEVFQRLSEKIKGKKQHEKDKAL